MLFVVISAPVPEPPSAVRERQQAFWSWLQTLMERGTVASAWRKAGRGVVAVLDVASHDELHALLAQWAEHVPAAFEIHPVMPAPHGAQAGS